MTFSEMTSTHSNDSFDDLYIGLKTGDVQNTVYSGSSNQSPVFYFPNFTGPTGSYLSTSSLTNGVGTWTGSTPITTLPTPRNDYYRTRTNEILSINVLTGSSGNTGGTDIPSLGPTGVTFPITNVTIVKNVTRGNLVSTGLLGGYTYQSQSRFTGRDYFSYTITDSLGVTSAAIGNCTIDVVASGVINSAVGITGSVFVSDGVNPADIVYYRFNTYNVLGTSPNTINNIATNRDDNLIYFSHIPVTPNMYFLDYMTGIMSNVDLSGITFSVTPSFGAQMCTYHRYNLFTYDISTDQIYKFALSPYTTDGITGYQKAIQLNILPVNPNYTAFGNGGDMAYDTISNIIFMKGGGTTGTKAGFDWICPTSSYLYKSAAMISRHRQVTFGYNHELLGEGYGALYVVSKYTMDTIPLPDPAGFNDMGEYINEAVT